MIEILVRDTDTGEAIVAQVVDYDYRPWSRWSVGIHLPMDIEAAIIDLEHLHEQNSRRTSAEV